eukprot:6350055-Prymnesium_polylepis.1
MSELIGTKPQVARSTHTLVSGAQKVHAVAALRTHRDDARPGLQQRTVLARKVEFTGRKSHLQENRQPGSGSGVGKRVGKRCAEFICCVRKCDALVVPQIQQHIRHCEGRKSIRRSDAHKVGKALSVAQFRARGQRRDDGHVVSCPHLRSGRRCAITASADDDVHPVTIEGIARQ